jgi:hypothetical protein
MQYDRLSKAYKELTGNYLVRVPGHYPIRRALALSERADIAKMTVGAYTIKALENAGFLIQRTGGTTPIFLGDFAFTQIDQFAKAEAVIQRGPLVKYLARTILHPDVSTQIIQRFGQSVMDRMTALISEYSGNETPEVDSLIRGLLSNAARAQTQVNFLTWMRNVSGITLLPAALNGGQLLGFAPVLKALAKAAATPRKTFALLTQYSPDLRERWSHSAASISLMQGSSNTSADSDFADALKGTLRQAAYAVKGLKDTRPGEFKRRMADVQTPFREFRDSIRWGNVFDAASAIVAYHAVRDQAPPALSDKKQDEWAVKRASDIFFQVANTNDLLRANQWQVEARRDTWKAGVLAFTSDIAKKQNLLVQSVNRGPEAAAVAAAGIALGLAWTLTIRLTADAALGEEEEKRVKNAIETPATELVSLLPAGTFASALLSGLLNPGRESGLMDSPLTGILSNFRLAFNDAFAIANEDAEFSDKIGGILWRLSKALNDITGAPFGPTAGQIRRGVINWTAEE